MATRLSTTANAYDTLTLAEQQQVDLTLLGAAFLTADTSALAIVKVAHQQVDVAVDRGALHPNRAAKMKQAISDHAAETFAGIAAATGARR